MIPYIMTDQSITLMLGTKPVVVPSSHANFLVIREGLVAGNDNAEFYRDLTDVKESIARWADGLILVQDNVLTYKDRPIDTPLTRKIIQFMKSGEDNLVAPLAAFLERLQGNPSFRAQQQLYQWVEKANLPITPDGFILAFKRVKKDYWDHNTGETFFHEIGAVLEMPRNLCDEDPDRTCSAGIHFCSIEYLKKGPVGSNDDPVMIVKIDPADVTAIPRDYNDTKGRCCRMEIVDEVAPEAMAEYFGTTTVFYGTEETKEFRYWPGQIWKTTEGDAVQLLPGTTETNAVYQLGGSLVSADQTGGCDAWDEDWDLVECLDRIDPYARFENGIELKPHSSTTPLGYVETAEGLLFHLSTGEHVFGQWPALKNVA